VSFSDAALIARVLAGDDRNAFGELVRRHQSQVRSLLRRLTGGDTARADDLAQETFIKAYRGLRKYQGSASFSTWIYRVAYNSFISSTRGSAKTDRDRDVDELPSADSELYSDRVLARFDLNKAAQDLPQGERAALALFYGQGLAHEEIARVLDCPLGTVKSYILRGKERLRKRLLALQAQEQT
jgi:RNA polymerase sigma-70 factor (ECF subfamily)